MGNCPQRPSLGDRRGVWRNRMVNSLYLLTYTASRWHDESAWSIRRVSLRGRPRALRPGCVLVQFLFDTSHHAGD
jgi:hypothetical protein